MRAEHVVVSLAALSLTVLVIEVVFNAVAALLAALSQ
jgi:hypothetical protein